MTLEEKFKENLEKWREHYEKTINSSNPQDDIDCDAYRNIVNMGTSVLLLIRKEYGANPMPLIKKEYGTNPKKIDKRESLNWLLFKLVEEIIGDDFQIPEWMRGKIPIIAKYTAKWLDENMDKYVKRI